MFNIGNDDKDKLKENMEEIKNLIENDDGSSVEQAPEAPEQPPAHEQPETDFENSFSQPAPQQNNPEPGQEATGNTAPADTEPVDDLGQEMDDMEGESFQQEETIPDENMFGGGSGPAPQERESSAVPENDPFSSPQEQQNDVTASTTDSPAPSSGETVFLTVDRFHQLKDKVDEMKYLSRQLEETADYLNSGVEEDEQTVQEAEQVIDEFENSREDIREIITSHEN